MANKAILNAAFKKFIETTHNYCIVIMSLIHSHYNGVIFFRIGTFF
jgi:hypothetical protein